MSNTSPIVDLKSNSVVHDGKTFFMRQLSEDAFTVLVEGVPVGRLVYTFGAANGVSESPTVTEASMTAIAEAWFAALDANQS
jgi:hypothetical protein